MTCLKLLAEFPPPPKKATTPQPNVYNHPGRPSGCRILLAKAFARFEHPWIRLPVASSRSQETSRGKFQSSKIQRVFYLSGLPGSILGLGLKVGRCRSVKTHDTLLFDCQNSKYVILIGPPLKAALQCPSLRRSPISLVALIQVRPTLRD